MGGGATLNLSVNNLLTSSGTAGFAGTLNISGDTGAAILMTYSSELGQFNIANVTGLAPGYVLAYAATDLAIIANGPPTWQFATSGSWNDATKWSNSAPPSAVGAAAIVGAATSVALNITLDTPQTLGTLTFTNTASSAVGYTLAAGTAATGSLTLANTGSMASQIVVNGGSHGISAPVYLVGGDLAVSASNNGVLTISGSISQDATRNLTLNGDGTGELILSGTNNLGGSGGTATVASGTLVLNDIGALADGTSLTIGDATMFGGIQPAGASSATGAAPIVSLTTVPEPGTLALLAAIAGSAAFYYQSRRRRA